MQTPSPMDELHRLRAVANGLRAQLVALDEDLDRLEKRLDGSETSPRPAITPPPVIPIAMRAEPAPNPTPAPQPELAGIPNSAGLIPPKIAAAGKSLESNLEARIGGTWFNRVGAIILLLGIGFFVKYSFDQGWLSPTVRVALGAMLGTALIVTGEIFLLRDLRNFAAGLLGAGIAVLYVSGYAAHAFYSLITLQASFVILCGVTAVAIVIAVQARTQAIAILALVGGFLTPFMLSTGRNQQTALLTYVAVLDAGFLIVALSRGWWILRLFSWVGTVGLFSGWYVSYYEPAALDQTLAWIALFYVIFQLTSIFAVARLTEPSPELAFFVHLQNAALVASVYGLADAAYHQWMAMFCIVVAVLQIVCALLLRSRIHSRQVQTALWIDAATLVAIAIALQFDGYVVALAWTAQACVYAFLCRSVPDKWLRAKLVIMLLLAVTNLADYGANDPRLIEPLITARLWHLNWLIIDIAIVAIGSYLASAMVIYRRAANIEDQLLSGVLIGLGTIILMTICAREYDRYVATMCWLVLAAAWLCVAPQLTAGKILLVILAGVISAKFITYDVLHAAFQKPPYWWDLSGMVLNRAVLTGVCVAVVALLVRRIALPLPARTEPESINAAADNVLLLLCPLVLLTIGTFEICRIFLNEPFREQFADRVRAMQMTVSVYWAVSAMLMLIIGFAMKASALRYIAIAVFAITIAKVMLVDITNLAMIYRIISFVVLGLLLLGASYLYQKRTLRERQTSEPA